MSYIWKMVCHETKQEVNIGQGYSEMDHFWRTEKDIEKLRRFLVAHRGKPLEFLGESDEVPPGYERFT